MCRWRQISLDMSFSGISHDVPRPDQFRRPSTLSELLFLFHSGNTMVVAYFCYNVSSFVCFCLVLSLVLPREGLIQARKRRVDFVPVSNLSCSQKETCNRIWFCIIRPSSVQMSCSCQTLAVSLWHWPAVVTGYLRHVRCESFDFSFSICLCLLLFELRACWSVPLRAVDHHRTWICSEPTTLQ